MLAAVNDLNMLSADVHITPTYLNTPTKEQVLYSRIACPEFGRINLGQPLLISRALYGLTASSGARWRDHSMVQMRASATLCVQSLDLRMLLIEIVRLVKVKRASC
jgi:hypothetical protein